MRMSDHSAREALIRDLYSLVAFFVANPDHPLPVYISVGCLVDSREDVQYVADRFGRGRTYGLEGQQTDHMLPGTSRDVNVIVRVASGKGIDE
jgi:hypothetical protein